MGWQIIENRKIDTGAHKHPHRSPAELPGGMSRAESP
jgi:hypothetical protein